MVTWFIHNGGLANPANPLNYTISGIPPICASGSSHLCSILAENNGNFPIITCEVKDNIINTLNARTNSPTVVLRF